MGIKPLEMEMIAVAITGFAFIVVVGVCAFRLVGMLTRVEDEE